MNNCVKIVQGMYSGRRATDFCNTNLNKVYCDMV